MTFQMTFAIITPALIVGAFADRMKFSALVLFMVLWPIIVYAPIAHWVWGGGFLGGSGVLDFAGGTVVHINAGIAGLVCALYLGKRTGYGTENMAPHNLVYSRDRRLPSVGRLVRLQRGFGSWQQTAAPAWPWPSRRSPRRRRRWPGCSPNGSCTRSRACSASSRARSPALSPSRRHRASSIRSGALWIGAAAGVGCFFAATTVKRALGYDDSLDVFGVHCVGGIIGAILTGVFARAGDRRRAARALLEGNAGQI